MHHLGRAHRSDRAVAPVPHQLLLTLGGVHPVRKRRHWPALPNPARHHRQERARAARHRDWLRQLGRPRARLHDIGGGRGGGSQGDAIRGGARDSAPSGAGGARRFPDGHAVTDRFAVLHGHFYQPPRENPWIEEIEVQDSAAPYHDWNERIQAECYGPNGAARVQAGSGAILDIVDNYRRLSFNFGPTLLAWLERKAPE